MKTLPRHEFVALVNRALARTPVTALLGPRQVGKTTLARDVAAERSDCHYFDLENPDDLRALDQAQVVLGNLDGLVVIDEVQRRPELFPVLRVLVDRPRAKTRFLVLGSASPGLLRQSSESLAGRIEFLELRGFGLDETGFEHWQRLWLRGGFPRAYLAASDTDAFDWLANFVRTYLERDLPQLGLSLPPALLDRFWTMVAHYHGQTWNSSEVARSLGISDQTTRRYLDVLTAAYLVRQLQPWFENVAKRQVKAPKVYLRDAGLLHRLLDIGALKSLFSHPKAGASWEGWAIEHILHRCGDRQAYFWATHGGMELDLLLVRGERRFGFEIKLADAPPITKSMRIALTELRLSALAVVYPGERRAVLDDRIELMPLSAIDDYLSHWGLLRPKVRSSRTRRPKR
ncbi:MAG: ATP-binding protein [Planctomycetes bacterium]|nr:ATP-binding protein [Planctomycetota bacterium]